MTRAHSSDVDPADALREVPADVATAATWSAANKFRLHMLFQRWRQRRGGAASGSTAGNPVTGGLGLAQSTGPSLWAMRTPAWSVTLTWGAVCHAAERDTARPTPRRSPRYNGHDRAHVLITPTGRFKLKANGQTVSHTFLIKAGRIDRIAIELPKRARAVFATRGPASRADSATGKKKVAPRLHATLRSRRTSRSDAPTSPSAS